MSGKTIDEIGGGIGVLGRVAFLRLGSDTERRLSVRAFSSHELITAG